MVDGEAAEGGEPSQGQEAAERSERRRERGFLWSGLSVFSLGWMIFFVVIFSDFFQTLFFPRVQNAWFSGYKKRDWTLGRVGHLVPMSHHPTDESPEVRVDAQGRRWIFTLYKEEDLHRLRMEPHEALVVAWEEGS